MHTIAYILKKKPNLDEQEFYLLYKEHQKVMLTFARGLVSYIQYPKRKINILGDVYAQLNAIDFDALSIYTYMSTEDAEYSTNLKEVIEDSEKFIDFNSMITLPLNIDKVI